MGQDSFEAIHGITVRMHMELSFDVPRGMRYAEVFEKRSNQQLTFHNSILIEKTNGHRLTTTDLD